MLKLCWSRPTAGGELVGRWVEVSPVERPLPEPGQSPFGESLLPARVGHAAAHPLGQVAGDRFDADRLHVPLRTEASVLGGEGQLGVSC